MSHKGDWQPSMDHGTLSLEKNNPQKNKSRGRHMVFLKIMSNLRAGPGHLAHTVTHAQHGHTHRKGMPWPDPAVAATSLRGLHYPLPPPPFALPASVPELHSTTTCSI